MEDQDELVKVVNHNLEQGWNTTRRSWMKPEDIEWTELPLAEHKPPKAKKVTK